MFQFACQAAVLLSKLWRTPSPTPPTAQHLEHVCGVSDQDTQRAGRQLQEHGPPNRSSAHLSCMLPGHLKALPQRLGKCSVKAEQLQQGLLLLTSPALIWDALGTVVGEAHGQPPPPVQTRWLTAAATLVGRLVLPPSSFISRP